MEEIGPTNPKYHASHCKLYGTRSCAHTQKTTPLAPIHSFTKQIVPSMYEESLIRSCLISMTRVFRMCLINSFLPSKNILGARRFFLSNTFFLSFSSHTFSWACGSLCEPRKFFSNSLFVHSFVCSLISQPNFYQHFSHVCPTCHTIFSL